MAIDVAQQGGGGYGPQTRVEGIVAVSFDSVVEDMVVPGSDAGLLPRNLAGDPIQVSFAHWNGDVLEVEYDASPQPDEEESATGVVVIPQVSVDGGANFDSILPGQSSCELGKRCGACLRGSVAIHIPGSTPPIVRLAYVADGNFALGGAGSALAAGSAHLKATRLTFSTIDQGPTGQLAAS
jgi:hypothetical protein